ncbi:hypothetical protein [Pseudonocardia sp. TRM90224]|uniref:hypothetical protein n=1 Tax=Pseudonocardia sp. TRM90224 TaxID=2812678 RepID=UPI001E45D167|nr:hypothetical protein [Pseudonocardia sp. TRM90224]
MQDVQPPDDLRLVDVSAVLEHVQADLGTRLDEVRCKRRTVSGRTDRGTWLRIECRTDQRVEVHGSGGIEAAAALAGVRMPAWIRALSWRDPAHGVWWRADETALVVEPTVATTATPTFDPGLDAEWWRSLRQSLSALATHPAPRFAKLGAGTTAQEHLVELVRRSAQLLDVVAPDCHVAEWTAAHADLTWANVTAPRCWILDWEDWGLAPRGFDAATMLLNSLGVPPLADQVRRSFAADLVSRSAQVAVLALAADVLAFPDAAGPLLAPTRREALRAVAALAR